MRLDPILTKTSRLARSGKHEAAIQILQPEVSHYRGSYRYYYLLGSCYLYSGDTGMARTYFQLAHEANRRDPLSLLGLAVLYLRRGEIDRAVDFYLEVLDIDPKNKIARKAMMMIRKYAGADAFAAWLRETGKESSLYPPIPFAGFYRREVLAALGVVAAVCMIVYGILVHVKFFSNPFNPRGPRQGASEFILSREERMTPVQPGESYRYILTRVQILDTYEKAHSLFNARRDEAAHVLLNKIIESNASDELKNRARIIISCLETPGFNTFHRGDNVDYSDVKNDLILHNGVHVIWRGMATNIKVLQEGTSFDFLVGYDNRRTLQGIVPVVFNYSASINPERPLEVLGKIILVNTDEGLALEGVNFHQSSSLE